MRSSHSQQLSCVIGALGSGGGCLIRFRGVLTGSDCLTIGIHRFLISPGQAVLEFSNGGGVVGVFFSF